MISVIIIPTHVLINVVQVIVIMYDVNIRKKMERRLTTSRIVNLS